MPIRFTLRERPCWFFRSDHPSIDTLTDPSYRARLRIPAAAAVLLLYRATLDGIVNMPSLSLLVLPWCAPLATVPRSSVFGLGVPMVILGLLFMLLRPLRNRQLSY